MEINDLDLEKIILDIESADFLNIEKRAENETFELWGDPDLLKDLSGNIGAIFVRALLRKLNVDEHHVFKWRPENKYRQYQILNYYIPGSVAETISFSNILETTNGVEKIKELCENGFFIKATLGHRTGNSFDRTKELDSIVNSYQKEPDGLEKWMLQKRLKFTEEFRIHTFSKDLIYGLTFIMKGEDPLKSKCAEEFLQKILEKLPDTILQGTLIGWDIGISDMNQCYVIEANFTGFHPEFARGFQTSGYFGDDIYGSIMCAWLNNYFRINYRISIDFIERNLYLSNKFYKEFIYYDSLIKSKHIKFIRNDVKEDNISAVIYLEDENIDALMKLTQYFLIENFADRYYLITNENHLLIVINEFQEDANVTIITENVLFTEDQYLLVKELSCEKRKKICFSYTMKLIKEGSYFMV